MSRVATDVASADLIEREPGEAGSGELGALIPEWLRYLELHEGCSRVHINKSAFSVRELLASTGWNTAEEITLSGAIEWVSSLIENGQHRKTAANKASCARQFARWLRVSGRLPHNPLADLRQPRVRGSDRGKGSRAFSVDEMRRLIEVAEELEARDGRGQRYGPHRSTLYRFLTFTMCRYSEAMNQVWSDVDLDGARMIVTLDKSRRRDWLPLHPELVTALRTLRAWQEAHGAPPEDRIFRRTCHHTLQSDMEEAGIPRAVQGKNQGFWHRFRKGAITARLASGQSPEVVRRLARHATLDMTMTIYNDLHSDEITDAAGDFSLLEVDAKSKEAQATEAQTPEEACEEASPVAVVAAEPYAPGGPLQVAGWIEYLDGRAGAIVVDEQGHEHVVRLLGEISYGDGAQGWVVADGKGHEHIVKSVAPGGDRPRGVLMGEVGQGSAAAEGECR